MKDDYIKPKRKQVIDNPDGSLDIHYELSSGEVICVPNIILIDEGDSIKTGDIYSVKTDQVINWFARKSRISPRDRDECYADIWLYFEEEEAV